MEWGWDRNRCIQEIRDAGLPLPGKSSCFFCPSMKRREIRTLYHRYPDLLARALAIEDGTAQSPHRERAGPELCVAGFHRGGSGPAGAPRRVFL